MAKEINYILLLHKNELWKSYIHHQKILIASYVQVLNNTKKIYCQKSENYTFDFKKKILSHSLNYNFVRIIVISPQVNLEMILKILSNLSSVKGEFIFHVYGNLFTQQKELIKIVNLLKNTLWKVKIISPSLSLTFNIQMILNSKKGIYTIPLYIKPLRQIKVNKNNSHQLTLGFLGRIAEEKNLHALLESFKNPVIYERYSLLIAGRLESHIYNDQKQNFNSHYLFKIAAIYNSLPPCAKSRIQFVGNLNTTELPSFFKKIDVLVSLSTFYGEVFGFNLMEACAYRKCILATKWSNYRHVGLSRKHLVNLKICKDGTAKIKQKDLERKLIQYECMNHSKLKRLHNNPFPLLKKMILSKHEIHSKKQHVLSQYNWSKYFS